MNYARPYKKPEPYPIDWDEQRQVSHHKEPYIAVPSGDFGAAVVRIEWRRPRRHRCAPGHGAFRPDRELRSELDYVAMCVLASLS